MYPMYVLMCEWLYEAWNGACLLAISYLLVLPEVSLDGDGDSVVLQLASVKELLQESPLLPSLLCQGRGHLWGTLHS